MYHTCLGLSEPWPHQDGVNYRAEDTLFHLCGLGVYIMLFALAAPLAAAQSICPHKLNNMLESGGLSMLLVCHRCRVQQH